MLNYQIELNGANEVCGGEIFPADVGDYGGESLLIGRNKWDGIYFLQGLSESWTLGKSARELFVTLSECDTLTRLIERLGVSDETREELRQTALEEQIESDRQRAAEELEATAVITR